MFDASAAGRFAANFSPIPNPAALVDLLEGPLFPPTVDPRMAPLSAALRHFHLGAHPFADNVDPDFFFRAEGHHEVYLRMRQCIEENVSIGMTTSCAGAGKTMMTLVLRQDLHPRHYRVALVAAFPGMTRAGLLREIAQELDAEPEDGLRASVNSYIQAIQAEITRLNRRGLKCVLIIDEAHFLCANSLNLLRSFGNIELPDRKLATILLFGENEFLRRLEHSSLKDFFGRIFERVELKPLTRDEVAQYIKFRCLMAGGGPSLFSNEIFGEIFRLSGGVPREVNRICRIAMDRAACRGSMRVDLAALE